MAGFLSPTTVKDNSTHYCYEQSNIFQLVSSHRKRASTLEGEADIRAANVAQKPKREELRGPQRGGKEKIGQEGWLPRAGVEGWGNGSSCAGQGGPGPVGREKGGPSRK